MRVCVNNHKHYIYISIGVSHTLFVKRRQIFGSMIASGTHIARITFLLILLLSDGVLTRRREKGASYQQMIYLFLLIIK